MPRVCRTLLPCTLLALAPGLARATCWNEAAQRHHIAPELLVAIARAESNLDPRAENLTHKAKTGTTDIGLMQINSSWLPKLARYGIDRARLFDPCVNLNVGAWILAQCFDKAGVTWDCVGAYNTACTQLKGDACTAARAKYAWRVYERLPAQGPLAQVSAFVSRQ